MLAGVTTEESEPATPSVQVDINHKLIEANTDYQLVAKTSAAYAADLSTHKLALKDKIWYSSTITSHTHEIPCRNPCLILRGLLLFDQQKNIFHERTSTQTVHN